ncbi:XRE family transcriptional regulator [Streptosporangium sp. NPDC051023]|uniref:XRE family transcriptional regulator n=1 Tax=Streptosporangium sp. NPDC051023 TaxID=3155410 RepID=UPI00344DF156
MARVSRARRAELQRQAHQIRSSGQRARWDVERIATAIHTEVPDILPLEAWRLAYGWSRAQAIAGISALYEADQLATPPLNSSMLCRWEHGNITPQGEYALMLSRLYQVPLAQLGLEPATAALAGPQDPRRPFLQTAAALTNGHFMTAENRTIALEALRESIQLALEVDGPAGGPLVREHLETAIGYYAANFSAFAPALLAVEVHRTRALVGAMLRQPQSDAVRTELRKLAGWLSALVGNLAFVLGDHTGAQIHLGTAARLGTTVGDSHLICWSLGAQAMTANAQQKFPEALDLSRQALEYADTPLRRAHILAWGQLRSLANLGAQHRSDALRVMAAAQDEMAADPHGEQPGRFGFDHAELQLHLAEVSLQFGDHNQGRTHAEVSRAGKTAGSPGWAAATLALARAEAARRNLSDAVALASEVLDTVPANAIRETSRARLRSLERDLFQHPDPGRESHAFCERLRGLPALVPVGRISDEPNGL